LKITKEDARKFAVEKQCFQPYRAGVGKEQIFRVLRELGCVQIDTINVVERSHYLAFWSRLGSYRKELLDQLLCPDRKVFEYWAHAASIIPMEYYRYFMHGMKERRKEMRGKARRWLKKDADLLDTVLHEIKRSGPSCSKDFKQGDRGKKKPESGWWNWKPAKLALELLYNAGVLMVSRREKFQKYYDLTENVLPSSIDTSEPTEIERQRFFLEKTINAWGIAEPKDVGYYFYTWSIKTRVGVKGLSGLIKKLEKEDVVTTVHVEGYDEPCLMLTRDSEALEKTVNAEEQIGAVSFLSPFDNLTGGRSRMRKLFGLDTPLEIYIPKQTRKFGYYALNILHNNQIIGRLDPKMHRDKATLEVKALELEKDAQPTRNFKQQLDLALKNFAKFHDARAIEVARSARNYCDSTTNSQGG
jgi:uncharacterized protein YcaQ